MDVTLKGKIVGATRGELLFKPMGVQRNLKLNITMGTKKYRGAFTRGLKERLLDLFKGAKVEIKGYCYNSNTMIAEKISFQDPTQEVVIDGFVDIIKKTKKEYYNENKI